VGFVNRCEHGRVSGAPMGVMWQGRWGIDGCEMAGSGVRQWAVDRCDVAGDWVGHWSTGQAGVDNGGGDKGMGEMVVVESTPVAGLFYRGVK